MNKRSAVFMAAGLVAVLTLGGHGVLARSHGTGRQRRVRPEHALARQADRAHAHEEDRRAPAGAHAPGSHRGHARSHHLHGAGNDDDRRLRRFRRRRVRVRG